MGKGKAGGKGRAAAAPQKTIKPWLAKKSPIVPKSKNSSSQNGTWVFVPNTASRWSGGKQAVQAAAKKAIAGGSTFGGPKVPQNQKPQADRKYMDKLAKIDASQKVWVGGLPKDATWQQLEAHFKDVVKPSTTVVMSKGTACIAFKTSDDAETAIASFNGSSLKGKDIQVDVWTAKEKTEKPKKEKKEGNKANVKINKKFAKTTFQSPKAKAAAKGKAKPAAPGKADPEMMAKLKEVSAGEKTWVGDLNKTTTWKQLKSHFVKNGATPKLCVVTKPGVACVTFASDEEASKAIALVNGTELDGKTITVDVWSMPEKKEKAKKEPEVKVKSEE